MHRRRAVVPGMGDDVVRRKQDASRREEKPEQSQGLRVEGSWWK